ncbi:hypothetical protein ACFP1Z_04850 [Streptomyces gamaensis]|uniref:Uncharacterized protein n=1 Tax=Streptomyces gamaensis TaxID=1763542 RepID=A0ABW0YYN5_9ACTN
MDTATGRAEGPVGPVPAARLVRVCPGPDRTGSWRRHLAPEVAVHEGLGAVPVPGADSLPWALFAPVDARLAEAGAALGRAGDAGRPAAHVLLYAGPDAHLPRLPGGFGCPVTVLVAASARDRCLAEAGSWRALAAAEFTVRLLTASSPLPGACDAEAARVVKEELRLWPA